MKSVIFTDDDFGKFKTVVEYWIEQFGLTEWNIDITHDQIGDRTNAQTQYNTTSKGAIIRLTKVSEGDFNMVTDVTKLALHEVLHLLLADFCETTAKLADTHHDLVVGREHELINKLMRVVK